MYSREKYIGHKKSKKKLIIIISCKIYRGDDDDTRSKRGRAKKICVNELIKNKINNFRVKCPLMCRCLLQLLLLLLKKIVR